MKIQNKLFFSFFFYKMFNPFYKINLFYTQKDAIEEASNKGHNLLFSVENTSLNKEGKRTYSYGSHLNAGTFLSYYNSLEKDKKHFNEVIPTNIHVYEYYDLDFKIVNEQVITNESLLNWFKTVRKEFIKHYFNDIVGNRTDDFIITTATNTQKVSLHILNRSIIFDNNTSLKIWYNSLKEFIYSFYDNDPLKSSIDFSVSSSYRSMRIIDSSKYGQDRPLKLLYNIDINNEIIYPIHTFITNALNDLDLSNKTISLAKSENTTSFRGKTSKHVYPSYNITGIEELLSLLSPNRAGDYDDWIKVGWALKRANVDINIFKEWSKENSNTKFNKCDNLWNSYDENKNIISLGTIHHFAKTDNPNGYTKFIEKYKEFKVDFPFTTDITINTKYIHENVYIDNLKTHDVIALKSNMNTGKTYTLPNLFNTYKVKVVVYFRISLNISIYNKWKDLGFELYSDIKDDIIKTTKHHNIIIQIDSLHRIQGKVDLLILDEIESTQEHICSSKYINKNKEYSCLKNMIKNTPKIIACDANLKDETVNTIFNNRNIIKVENTFKSFSNLSCNFFFDREDLIQKVFDLLSSNKNIVIPTNSIKISEDLYSIITKRYPELNVLKMNSKTKFTEISEWSNYNVVIYTPKIVAGISFDEIHFHSVVAFFINKSCNAEPSSQMLFRVRNLIDNNIFIYTPRNTKESYLPIENEDIYSYLNNVIKEGNFPIDKTGLDIDKFNEKVKKNDYYLIYKSYIKKKNISRQYFYSYLKNILINHGIKCSYTKPVISNNIKNQIKEDIKMSSFELKVEDAEKISEAPIIYLEDYVDIIDKKEDERTEDDLYSIKRYNLVTSYNLSVTTPLTTDWVMKSIPYAKSYKNYMLFTDKPIDDSIKLAQEFFNFSYNRGMIESQNIDVSSSSEDSGYEGDEDMPLKKKRSGINIKKVICHALTYDRKYLKIKICLEMIKYAGFSSINHIGKVKLDWNSLYNFIYRENKNISDIFDSKPFKFSSNVFDPKDGSRKKVMMEFMNNRLRDLFGVKIERTCRNDEKYEITTLFKNIVESLIISIG